MAGIEVEAEVTAEGGVTAEEVRCTSGGPRSMADSPKRS